MRGRLGTKPVKIGGSRRIAKVEQREGMSAKNIKSGEVEDCYGVCEAHTIKSLNFRPSVHVAA
jgi:hypothetical protein